MRGWLKGLLGLMISSVGAEEAPLVLSVPLEAARSVQVYAYLRGVVDTVRVQVGDRVVAGDTLAGLEAAPWRRAEIQARLGDQQAQARLQRALELHEQGGLSRQVLEGLGFDRETARLRWEAARAEYAQTVLVAPAGGLVAEGHLQPGVLTTAGQVAFRLIDPQDLKATLFIPADRMQGLQKDQLVTAQTHALEAPLKGRLIQVSPLVDPASGTCRVEVLFRRAGPRLRPGTVVQVHLEAVTQRR